MTAFGYTGGDPSKVSTTGYAKGNVLAADGTGTLQPLPVGTDGQFLEALSTAPDGVTWATGGGGGGTPSNTVVTETAYSQASTAGVAATYSRGDHTHGTPAAVTVPTAAGTVTSGTSYGTASTAGVATTYSRGDHGHGTPPQLSLPAFPPLGYNLVAMSGNPESFMGVAALANNNPFFVRVYVPPGKPITGVYVAVRDAGTYDGVTTGNTINVYDDAAATTLLGTIGETPTLWAANGWRGGNIVGGPLAASASERFIYVGAIAKGMTVAPNVTYMTSAQDAQAPWFDFGVGQTHKRGMYVNATALPASFDPTIYGTSTTFLLMVGIA